MTTIPNRTASTQRLKQITAPATPAADGLVISSPAADAYQLATSIEGTNSQGEQGAS
jgi:hypothetical protein